MLFPFVITEGLEQRGPFAFSTGIIPLIRLSYLKTKMTGLLLIYPFITNKVYLRVEWFCKNANKLFGLVFNNQVFNLKSVAVA